MVFSIHPRFQARIASSVPPDGLSLSLRMILDDNTVLKLIHFVSVFLVFFRQRLNHTKSVLVH